MFSRHRVLAELLEQGTRSTLKIPDHRPVPSSTSNANLAASAGIPKVANALDAGALGLNPSHALQHPGYYYYMAARCTEMRRERFLFANEIEVRFQYCHYFERCTYGVV
jgi:trafficking protein particle complex subunit 11